MNRQDPATIRRARSEDVEAIAAAHRDSIESIGRAFYDADVVREWSAHIRPEMYVEAMRRGEMFYVAVGDGEDLLGFSSHHVDAGKHRTAVYVRGRAARRGIGSALFRTAEADAIASGADSIHVASSLAAVDFYKANGFEHIRAGEHQLPSGHSMACVFMRKRLSAR